MQCSSRIRFVEVGAMAGRGVLVRRGNHEIFQWRRWLQQGHSTQGVNCRQQALSGSCGGILEYVVRLNKYVVIRFGIYLGGRQC